MFTIGRRGDISNLLVGQDSLSGRGIRLVRTDRGGDITFHGPGQIIAYPIIDLKNRGRDLHRFLRDLERAAIDLLDDYLVEAGRVAGRTGVWVDGAKVASIGIGSSNWVTYHGLSINVSCDLGFFEMIQPCGIEGARATSIENILHRCVSMEDARGRLVCLLSKIFCLEVSSYESCTAMA